MPLIAVVSHRVGIVAEVDVGNLVLHALELEVIGHNRSLLELDIERSVLFYAAKIRELTSRVVGGSVKTVELVVLGNLDLEVLERRRLVKQLSLLIRAEVEVNRDSVEGLLRLRAQVVCDRRVFRPACVDISVRLHCPEIVSLRALLVGVPSLELVAIARGRVVRSRVCFAMLHGFDKIRRRISHIVVRRLIPIRYRVLALTPLGVEHQVLIDARVEVVLVGKLGIRVPAIDGLAFGGEVAGRPAYPLASLVGLDFIIVEVVTEYKGDGIRLCILSLGARLSISVGGKRGCHRSDDRAQREHGGKACGRRQLPLAPKIHLQSPFS